MAVISPKQMLSGGKLFCPLTGYRLFSLRLMAFPHTSRRMPGCTYKQTTDVFAQIITQYPLRFSHLNRQYLASVLASASQNNLSSQYSTLHSTAHGFRSRSEGRLLW